MAKSIVRVYCVIRFMLGLSFSFFSATYTIFLISNGLDLLEVNAVNTCFMLACFFLEVPTGAVADVYGRKVSFILSCLVLSVSFFIYFFSSSFIYFIVAEVIGALGHTLYTGAFKSWMIDEVKRSGEFFDVTKAYRNGKMCGTAGLIIGALMGGQLGKLDIALPWLATACTMSLTAIVGMIIIKENPISYNKKSFRQIFIAIKEGYKICRGNRVIMFTIMLGFFWNFSCGAFNMYWQPHFGSYGMDTGELGWLFSGVMIMVAIGAYLSGMVYRIFRSNGSALLFTIIIFAFGGLFAALLSPVWLSLPMFLVHEISRGMYEPLLDDCLNREISEETRATIQSYQAMVSTLGAGLGLFISGLIAKNYSIEASWIFSSLIIFMFFVFSVIKTK